MCRRPRCARSPPCSRRFTSARTSRRPSKKKAVRVIEKAARSAADYSRRAGERRCCAFPEQHWRRIRTTDEMDKQFFMKGRCSWTGVILLSLCRGAILPSCPPTLQPRRLGVGQGWPHLRPSLVRVGSSHLRGCCRVMVRNDSDDAQCRSIAQVPSQNAEIRRRCIRELSINDEEIGS